MTSRSFPALGAVTLALPLVLALAGCSGTPDDASSKPTTLPVPSGLVGSIEAGTVAGRLVATGGPSAAKSAPLAGTVVLTSDAGSRITVPVGPDGRFRVGVAPGAYRIVGHSPDFLAGKGGCTTGKQIWTLAAGDTVVVDVSCPRR